MREGGGSWGALDSAEPFSRQVVGGKTAAVGEKKRFYALLYSVVNSGGFE